MLVETFTGLVHDGGTVAGAGNIYIYFFGGGRVPMETFTGLVHDIGPLSCMGLVKGFSWYSALTEVSISGSLRCYYCA